MKILVGWDNPKEAELISLYLNNDEHSARVVEPTALLDSVRGTLPEDDDWDEWDVILMTTGDDETNGALECFRQIHELRPNCPSVGACHPNQTSQLTRFIAAGMRTYVLRDEQGDFIFLLLQTLENTVQAVLAEREQLVAEKLREEMHAVLRFERAMIPEQLFSPSGYACDGRYESSVIRVRGGAPVLLAGGDFYETFPIDESRAGIVIADAAGHGMQACLSIAILQTYLQACRERPVTSASEFVEALNSRFCRHRIVRKQGNLITVLFGILDNARHTLLMTSAGHPLPILHARQAAEFTVLADGKVSGPPLGVDEDLKYREFGAELPARARLVCYTDGLTEASPEERSDRQFGVEGVEATLRGMVDSSPAAAISGLLQQSMEFTEGGGRHDDTSILIVDRVT